MAVAREDHPDSALQIGGALLRDRGLNSSLKLARSARQPCFTRQARRRLSREVHMLHGLKVLQEGMLKARDIRLHGSLSGRDVFRVGIAVTLRVVLTNQHRLHSAALSVRGHLKLCFSASFAHSVISYYTMGVACNKSSVYLDISLPDAISGARERGGLFARGAVLALPFGAQYMIHCQRMSCIIASRVTSS